MANQYIRFPASTATTSADIEVALIAVFPTNIVGIGLYNDAAAHNITASFTEVAGSAAVPATTKRLQISSIIGNPIMISAAADSGAAAASTKQIALVAGGGPIYAEYTYVTGDKLFMKTLDGTTVSDGNFVINFLG